MYSVIPAIESEVPAPKIVSTNAYAASNPAVTPDDVQKFPSTVHRAFATQLTFGPCEVAQAHEYLFVVAFRPSRTPVDATSAEPVQIVRRYCRVGTVSTIH